MDHVTVFRDTAIFLVDYSWQLLTNDIVNTLRLKDHILYLIPCKILHDNSSKY